MAWNRYSNHGGFRPYVSVATRRANAAKHAQKLAKGGATLSPVTITGTKIATSFWGKAWCTHLESYSDFASRLPRGRTYVRNGSVIDLQIAPGKITAQVMGSSLYKETITIAPLDAKRWAAIKAECAGRIDSLVGLLQGQLSDAVMRIITDRERGLFPAPSEIKLGCSCPDWADMCKHVAAVLYGVGARLDAHPELLFVLRGVDYLELITAAAQAPRLAAGTMAGAGAMGTAELADVFGIEIEDAAPVAAAVASLAVAAPFAPLAVAKLARVAAKKPASRTPAVKPVRPAAKSAAKAKQTPPSKRPRKTAAIADKSVRPKKSGDAVVKRRASR